VHAGFLEYYDVIREDVFNTIYTYSDPATDTLAFTGHSLGGCAAMIGALEISQLEASLASLSSPTPSSTSQQNSARISCITFGTPALGNESFCNSFNTVVPDFKSYVCGADITPRFPIPGLKHPRTGIYLPAPKWSGVRDTIAHHTMTNYLKPLRERARASDLKYRSGSTCSKTVR
jgi:hypothetical protein